MKQITLRPANPDSVHETACPGKLFAVWGLYGLAMAPLWALAGANGLAQAAAWAVALAAGLGLMLGMREV